MQKRLDENPHVMRTRRETSEHPFGTMKLRMGATHFLMKTLPKVATEMALCVLTYNLTRVLNIVGVPALLESIKGWVRAPAWSRSPRCAWQFEMAGRHVQDAL